MYSIHKEQYGGFRKNVTQTTIFDNAKYFGLNIPYINYLNHRNFKIYFPPGTYEIKLSCSNAVDSRVGTVSRIGKHPKKISVTYDTFFDEMVSDDDGYVLSECREMDCRTRSYGEHIHIMNWRGTPLTKGVWLYNILVEPQGGIVRVHPTVKVMKDTFFNWFNSVKDNNTLWTASGDPVEGISVSPLVVDAPPIIPPMSKDGPIVALPDNGQNNNDDMQGQDFSISVDYNPKGLAQLKDISRYLSDYLVNKLADKLQQNK